MQARLYSRAPHKELLRNPESRFYEASPAIHHSNFLTTVQITDLHFHDYCENNCDFSCTVFKPYTQTHTFSVIYGKQLDPKDSNSRQGHKQNQLKVLRKVFFFCCNDRRTISVLQPAASSYYPDAHTHTHTAHSSTHCISRKNILYK